MGCPRDFRERGRHSHFSPQKEISNGFTQDRTRNAHGEPPSSAYPVLGFKAQATLPGFYICFIRYNS